MSLNITNEEPLVSVLMITYKHEEFIEQAVRGVLNQICNFRFELIVADDCSPDNTKAIVESVIRSHPAGSSVKYTRHVRNLGMHGNTDFVIQAACGKYIAICEGDDFWTDPFKLNKQVDFLEKNSDYGMVHTDFINLNNSSGDFFYTKKNRNFNPNCFEDLLYGNYSVGTLTACYRKDIALCYFNEIKPSEQNWKMGDLPMWLYFAFNSKIHFLNEITSVYRILNESASQTNKLDKILEFESSIYDVKKFFIYKYSNNCKIDKMKIENHFAYRKLIINVNYNGEAIDFIKSLLRFYSTNTDFFKFLGSFKQCIKKARLILSNF